MKSVVLAFVMMVGLSAQASESWVCLCYSNAQKTDEVGGISLDPSLSLNEAISEALSACKANEPSTVAASCSKFNDGEDQ